MKIHSDLGEKILLLNFAAVQFDSESRLLRKFDDPIGCQQRLFLKMHLVRYVKNEIFNQWTYFGRLTSNHMERRMNTVTVWKDFCA